MGERGEPVTKTLNELARHRMIVRLYQDIRVDMMVCEIEGWDKKEYIRQLQEIINHFKLD